tara:strand:+ start:1004 stop:1315 length:312 start_codon:yes stop_codon:yes gene_type:complete
MTKKGPLGRAEVHYIKSFHENKTPQELAKDLDRAVSIVKKEITKIKPEDGEGKEERGQVSGALMARQDGIVVMTEGASAYSDVAKKPSNTKRSKCIVRIKKDG